MHRSQNYKCPFALDFWPIRVVLSLGAAILMFGVIGPVRGQAVVVPGEGVSSAQAQALATSALHLVNELSNRRRLTTFFANDQSPFYGVQINYVNTGRGNLTFLNRDLVRLDRVPIVAGRVYDSQLEAESDFGPGWKLSVTETIRHRGNTLRYIDASGSVYELLLQGTRVVSPYPHLTGISGGQRDSGQIEIRTAQFTKKFTNIGGDFYLRNVTDRFGNSLSLQYSGARVSRISSQSGRYVEIQRDAAGRIVSMHDDGGRTIEYGYDSGGRLAVVRGIGNVTWQYRHDAGGRLTSAIDPRGIDALTADYAEDGRVANIKVLYDTMSFSYGGIATAVRNGLQQGATFWRHDSGLTNVIQDFEGSTTEIEFADSLRPTSLAYNGEDVATFQYTDRGSLRVVRTSIDGRPRITRFSYDDAGRLATVVADDERVARYTYDSAGRILRAEDGEGSRSYEYFGGTGLQVGFAETELDIETNRHGLMTGFSNGHQSVALSYNQFDQVADIDYVAYGDVYEVDYKYGISGLRSSGSYSKATEKAAPASLSLDYDVIGNLTNLTVEAPTGSRSSQMYVLGDNNQLTRLMNPRRPDVVFEYDFAGRPTRRTLAENDVRYEYDALGRIAAVYDEERKLFEWRYGPMDVDAATEADDHTPWTTVNEPIASAIFGSVESIAYARTRGTPFSPIRFSPAMARFVVPSQVLPSPDSVLLASLQRRNLPLSVEHHANASPAPLGFDKPSNALFLPAEFSSLNCYMCVSWIVGNSSLTMKINGTSSGTAVGSIGVSNFVEVTEIGNAECWADVADYSTGETWTEVGDFVHVLNFDNGFTTTKRSSGLSPSTTRSYTYYYPSVYSVTDDISCGCADGQLIWEGLGAVGRNILVTSPTPPPPVVIRLTFDDGPHVGGTNNTQTVYAALQTNPVQSNIPATFFVQTHVSYRGGSSAGASVMAEALSRGHDVMIHTGSTSDHTLHTQRVLQPPYAGGNNALESDLIQARNRIAGLPGGGTPIYVRPPEGAYNGAVVQSYSATQLTMKLWDVVSGDDVSGATFGSISAQLAVGLRSAINGGDSDIVILFHDIHSHTADNLGGSIGYLQQIKNVANNLGRSVTFAKL